MQLVTDLCSKDNKIMRMVKLQGEEERKQGIYYEFDSESEALGEGGMGRVYLGKRIDNEGRVSQVAIKAMFESLPDLVIERARREASIKIQHESLVLMHSFIESKEKDNLGGYRTCYYVVSEYLEGISLADFIIGNLGLKNGELNPKIAGLYKGYTNNREYQSTEIIKKVLSGVMALHDLGFIHRDIDPSNIMITTEGKIKLIDFGVAKEMLRLNTADKGLTSSGQFLGKAAYAAPELILGNINEQNFSTDVYAIGILYFQLLTGNLPFEGNSYDVMQAQLHKGMPLRVIKSHQISKVIKKATEKRQSNRYSTAAQFRAAIDGFVFPEPWYSNIHIKGLSIGLSIVAVALFAWVVYPKEPTTVRNEYYQECLVKLNSSVPNDVSSGFEGMLKLAEEGHVPAMYQIAYTYAWIRKDSLSAMRKKNLGLTTDSLGLLTDKSKNEDAITWMKKIVQASDSTNYQIMAWLANYYMNGKIVNRDMDVAIGLLKKSKDEAAKQQDMVHIEKINKVLLRINKYKYEN